MLCPRQAQVLHNLPTGQALPRQRLLPPVTPQRGLLKRQRADRTSWTSRARDSRFQGFQTAFQQEISMTIVRYEPWAFVSRVQRHLDRALGETQGLADGAATASVSWIPHVDIREEAERFVVVADVPGVEPKDIEITADKGVLTVR